MSKIVTLRAKNVSDRNVPFVLRLIARSHVVIDGEYLLTQLKTDETCHPGEEIEMCFEWPFADVDPFDVIWRAHKDTSKLFEMHWADVDGEPLISNCPPSKGNGVATTHRFF